MTQLITFSLETPLRMRRQIYPYGYSPYAYAPFGYGYGYMPYGYGFYG